MTMSVSQLYCAFPTLIDCAPLDKCNWLTQEPLKYYPSVSTTSRLFCIIFNTRHLSATLPETCIKPTWNAHSSASSRNFSIYLALVPTFLTLVHTAGPSPWGIYSSQIPLLSHICSTTVAWCASCRVGAPGHETEADFRSSGSFVGCGGGNDIRQSGYHCKG